MNFDNFPDPPLGKGSPPPTTIDNVAHLLDLNGINARYNEVKKKVEIDIPGHLGTGENLDEVTMNTIVSLAAKWGMKTGNVPAFVDAVADRHAFNPVADWIKSREWDGNDRIVPFMATVEENGDYPPTLKNALLRTWIRSAAAAALMPGYKGRGVLTFQGPQGIGKTSWVKSLVTDPKLRDSVVKLDHHMDSGNKDSILGAIAHWIVEIGELDSSFKKDVARLKGFITADSDRVRRPYARRESEYPRRTLFVATVNDPNFLVDSTGNSRWWTIAVDKLNYDHTIDMQQVFAQAMDELNDGRKWWLTPHQEAELAEWNSRHVSTSVVADFVVNAIELDNPRDEFRKRLTASEMLIIAGIDRPTNAQAKECAAILRDLFGAPTRIRGRDKWRVTLKDPTSDGFSLVCGGDAQKRIERTRSIGEKEEVF